MCVARQFGRWLDREIRNLTEMQQNIGHDTRRACTLDDLRYVKDALWHLEKVEEERLKPDGAPYGYPG